MDGKQNSDSNMEKLPTYLELVNIIVELRIEVNALEASSNTMFGSSIIREFHVIPDSDKSV